MESIQYNAALAITGNIRGSSREKLYQELGLESLQQRRWYRKLCYFFKLTKNKSPKYLFNYIPTVRSTYRRRNIDNIPQFNVRHTFFRNSYFPSIVTEWNNLDKSIMNSESFSIFKKNILKFIRPSPNSIFNCHNPKGAKLLTRLRLGLSISVTINLSTVFKIRQILFATVELMLRQLLTTSFTALFFLMKG